MTENKFLRDSNKSMVERKRFTENGVSKFAVTYFNPSAVVEIPVNGDKRYPLLHTPVIRPSRVALDRIGKYFLAVGLASCLNSMDINQLMGLLNHFLGDMVILGTVDERSVINVKITLLANALRLATDKHYPNPFPRCGSRVRDLETCLMGIIGILHTDRKYGLFAPMVNAKVSLNHIHCNVKPSL